VKESGLAIIPSLSEDLPAGPRPTELAIVPKRVEGIIAKPDFRVSSAGLCTPTVTAMLGEYGQNILFPFISLLKKGGFPAKSHKGASHKHLCGGQIQTNSFIKKIYKKTYFVFLFSMYK
jgi:hypothetical protein